MAITLHFEDLSIIKRIIDWVEDQTEHPNTTEVRMNFSSMEIEVYDYESGVVHSRRPLSFFEGG